MRAEEILDRGRALLASKGQDYCEDREANQYQNFERANIVASWFTHDEDKSFAVLIGTKLARLASLLNGNKRPNNESILDTFIDGANYFALWGGKRVRPNIEELDKILNSECPGPYDKPAPDEKSNPSREAECKIIELASNLDDLDLHDTTEYFRELYKNRMMTNERNKNIMFQQNQSNTTKSVRG